MIINGFKIHPELLEEVYAERCVLHECLGACCTGGAWLDVEQLKIIVPHVEAIKANLPDDRRDPNAWFSAPAADEDAPEGAIIGTNVVDDPRRPGETCCVFLRPDRLCALQVTSQQLGLAYPGLKPLFCALVSRCKFATTRSSSITKRSSTSAARPAVVPARRSNRSIKFSGRSWNWFSEKRDTRNYEPRV